MAFRRIFSRPHCDFVRRSALQNERRLKRDRPATLCIPWRTSSFSSPLSFARSTPPFTSSSATTTKLSLSPSLFSSSAPSPPAPPPSSPPPTTSPSSASSKTPSSIGEKIMSRIQYHDDGMPRYPSLTTAGGRLRLLDYIGTVTFAISGAITAGMCGMDLFGSSLVGTITAIGGGTLRDVLVLHQRPFWFDEWDYLAWAVGSAAVCFLIWPFLPHDEKVKRKPRQITENDDEGEEGEILVILDTAGIAAFCVVGCQNAVRLGAHPLVCVVCGIMTATFGGMIRDVICRLPVRICHDHASIYAPAAMVGASSYIVARQLNFPSPLRILAGISSVMVLRYYVHTRDVKLPTWNSLRKWKKQLQTKEETIS